MQSPIYSSSISRSRYRIASIGITSAHNYRRDGSFGSRLSTSDLSLPTLLTLALTFDSRDTANFASVKFPSFPAALVLTDRLSRVLWSNATTRFDSILRYDSPRGDSIRKVKRDHVVLRYINRASLHDYNFSS